MEDTLLADRVEKSLANQQDNVEDLADAEATKQIDLRDNSRSDKDKSRKCAQIGAFESQPLLYRYNAIRCHLL